jgi:threonine/homoserine/homoserine lactone efflux protein
MFRSILGFALFAVVAFLALKLVLGLFGIVIGLAMTLLVWAAFGFLIYLGIRIVSPSTAEKIREMVRGRPADA